MASFVAYVPRSGVSLTPELLSWELIERGLRCHVDSDEDGPLIFFEETRDVLFPSVRNGEIDYLEHNPHYLAKPSIAGRISDALTEIGFEWVDEDDPRWREAE
ncbi:MAG TPA: hypothetical protein VGI81_00260 [Tepidisphaeraceae bacterium]|jgi:hypothetical protein